MQTWLLRAAGGDASDMDVVPKFKWGDFDEDDDAQQQERREQQMQMQAVQEHRNEEEVFSEPKRVAAASSILSRSGESREWFRQRLWCYLFENLNRAIDELYFMCELECDMEQIQEALLVFDEAGLDFSELKNRVEGFHKLSKAADAGAASPGTPSNQVEHQRPHAIAWEVRRMASSPRRADILSLSLDAFKRVQLESGKHETGKRRESARFLSFETDCPMTPPTLKEAAKRSDDSRSNTPATTDGQPCSDKIRASTPAVTSAPTARPDGGDYADASGEDSQVKTEDPQGQGEQQMQAADGKKGGLDAWKEKRNWEDILSSPIKNGGKASGVPPAVGRKSTERGRVLHDKLMSPERKKKTPMEMKKEVDEKQARATRIRMELDNERALRLQRTTEKLNRVSEWQAVKSNKLREGMHARQQRGESRHEAHLAQIARRASDESSKVSEVRFITSLNEENKKLSLQQKLQDSEVRRAERLQSLRIKQKEDLAREEAALERRKLLEAERLQRIADTQRKKEEAQARREEERKAASAAREARAVEQVRKKEVRAKAQEHEVELLRQRLAERLRESSLRRKVYLEQIRERAVMEPREQGSPLSRRPSSREGQPRMSTSNEMADIASERDLTGTAGSATTAEHPSHAALKKRVKKIRQRLTLRKFDLPEVSIEGASQANRSKVARWVQDLQRCQQDRKAGPSAIVSVVAEMSKALEGKDLELHLARQTGLLDYVSTALTSSYNSKQHTTIALLKLLLVLLSQTANRAYFLARNLLPPLVPLLSSALESYSTVGCSNSTPGNGSNNGDEKLDAVGEVLEDLVKCVALIMGHSSSDDRLLQMQDNLVELVVACDIVHRLRNLFALFDRPQIEGAPFPPPVLLGLKLLETLTSAYDGNKGVDVLHMESHCSETLDEFSEQSLFIETETRAPEPENHAEELPAPSKDDLKRQIYTTKSGSFLLVSVAETRLVGLPSLLTAVLLQANPRSSPEQVAAALPSNFEEVATSVLRVLNNTASLDLSLVQTMLAMPDLKMEFFHLASFLLSYCTSKWRVASDQVAALLFETLLLLGYFSLLHSGNQAVLRWGKSPTILHKICDLPFAFFSDPELTPILVGTLLPACYGCERNRDVIQQELSMEMLLSVLRSKTKPEALPKPTSRMEVITEDSAVETAKPKEKFKEDGDRLRTKKKSECVARKLKSEIGSEERLHTLFLVENRFPLVLWHRALEFFTPRTEGAIL